MTGLASTADAVNRKVVVAFGRGRDGRQPSYGRQVIGLSGRRVLSQLGPLCGREQPLIRNSRRTAAFQSGERVSTWKQPPAIQQHNQTPINHEGV